MVYQARLNADDTWDLEDPDGNVIEANRPLPVDESDPDLWQDIYRHAQQGNQLGLAFACVRTGIEIIDER